MRCAPASRRAFLRAGVAAALLAACKPSAAPPMADFYVSVDGDDAWTGTLARPNAARTDGPFATLQRAQRAMRQRIAQRLTRDARVLVRGGTYLAPAGLTFTPADSGTAEHRVTYAAYPGETPVVVGGVRLSGWQPAGDGAWKADLPDGVQVQQLFENGARMPLARAPKQGYFRVAAPQGRMAFEYRAEDLDAFDPGAWDISSARVTLWPQYNWFNFTRPVAAIDAQHHTLTLRGTLDGYEITAGNRYAVLNVLALLTEPGECQIDTGRRTACCRPRQTPIEDQVIVASTAASVVRIQGEGAGRPVRNLHLEGFDFSIANGDVVSITEAEDCSVQFCRIENGGENGAHVFGRAQRITLYGNLICEHGYCGVALEGLAPGQPDVNHHHRVENNHIHHCGRLVGHGAGVYIQQSGHNQVLHNHIHHTPRYGTTIKGLRYQSLRESASGVTWDNHYDYLHSRNNLIAYNDIHHANQDSQDTGAMESWGPGRDNVYDHNLVHDSGNAEFDIQSGLYLDDASDHFTVTNTIIWGITGAGSNQCVFAKGIGNRFDNNILVVEPGDDAAFTSMEMGGEACRDHVYTRNVIAVNHLHGAVYKFINWSRERIQVSDYNLVWKREGNVFCLGTPAGASRWEEWRAMGYDAHSALADPLFAAPDNRDYRPGAGSPAIGLGFKPIDTRAIGLKPDFPARFDRR